MSKLLLTFYGDDFTGSTDALEQLTLAGIRAVLFIKPPSRNQLARFKNLQAIGVAGLTRSMSPLAMERELRPALKKLKALGAPHVHYKVCSTFDSSPGVGSIGRAIDVAATIFKAPFIPLLVAAPALGRHCVFGTLFARMGIGSDGGIHRLDRHPSMSRHPVTPMGEADLRAHLSKQTTRRIALFDILKVALPADEGRRALKTLLAGKPDIVLFDALHAEQLARIGGWIDACASSRRPLFSVGSSGIETALGDHWMKPRRFAPHPVAPAKQVLVGSGSCSPVTSGQIARAMKHGFVEVPVKTAALVSVRAGAREIKRASDAAVKWLRSGRSVIVHTSRRGPDRRVAAKLKGRTARVLGRALGTILGRVLKRSRIPRVCIAGGDTSSFAAQALGIEALEMIAPLTPGAPLCRAHAPGSPMNGLEVVFKGGQVGAEDYFVRLLGNKRK